MKSKRFKNQCTDRFAKMFLSERFILSQTHPLLQRWTRLLHAIAVIHLFLIPFDISFHIESQAYVVWGILVDCFYLVDLLLNLFTDYTSQDDEIVRDQMRILIHYFKSTKFYSDFLALLGSAVLSFIHPAFKVLKMFKMLSFRRLSETIMTANLSLQTKIVLRIGITLTKVFLFIHFIACGWNQSLISSQQPWFMKRDFIHPIKSSILDPALSKTRKYEILLYSALVGYGRSSLRPTDEGQHLVAILILTLCLIFILYLQGQLYLLTV